MDTIEVISQNTYSGYDWNIGKCEIYEMSLVLIVLHKTTVVKVLTLSREYKRYTTFRVCSDDC